MRSKLICVFIQHIHNLSVADLSTTNLFEKAMAIEKTDMAVENRMIVFFLPK